MDSKVAEEHEIIVAATGDSMITRRLSPYTEENFLAWIRILRNSDVAFTNLEGMIHNCDGYPMKAYTYGTYMRAPLFVADELKWAGFNMISIANNHTMDFSEEAIRFTVRALNKIGVAFSGAGMELREARQPAYLETKNGRAALVSICTCKSGAITGETGLSERASESRANIRGRPGFNGIRLDTIYEVDSDTLEQLKKIRSRLKVKKPHFFVDDIPLRSVAEGRDELIFLNKRFIVGDKTGVRMILNKADVQANLKIVRDARRQADWVFVSFHSHEYDVAHDKPAAFVQRFAKDCLDNGAHAFIGQGEHGGQGIEIYRSKPIFYSLGTFIMQTETLDRIPADGYEKFGLDEKATTTDYNDARSKLWKGYLGPWYFKTVIALFRLRHDGLTDLKLLPVDSRYELPSYQRGRPLLADEKIGREIIERYKKLSASFGTKIEFKEGLGIVNSYK